MSFIQRYGRCVYATTNAEPNQSNLYVNLGLPSGTLWYNTNLGANNLTERGLYFSWGNTDGYTATYVEGEYSGFINNYNFTANSYSSTNGYQISGTIPLEKDIASQILGDGWRIPTDVQFQELIDNCTIENTTIEGVPGKLFTSNINGNTLFFPNNGYGVGTLLDTPKFYTSYWTNVDDEIDNTKAVCFHSGLSETQLGYIHSESKHYGFGIRAVKVIS